jgi:hypothetical protein
VWPKGAKDVPEPFARWRDAVYEMRPRYYRLVVDWPSNETDIAAHKAGCMREIPPCAGYNGLREQLEALAAAQKAQKGGWEVLLVPYGTPDRFAQPASGCERPGTQPRSHPPNAEGIKAYGQFIAHLQDEAKRAGVRIRYWSPWNEPNHPFFISPQRTRCSTKAPSAAIEPYAQLARAMKAQLHPDQEMVLGELAGLRKLKPRYTRMSEFLGGLPKDVACSASIVGQHAYVGGPDPVDDVDAAMRAHGCPKPPTIWITETGSEEGEAGARACRNIRKRLLKWDADPRVSAAFQYTVREDDHFPTGLVTTDLTKARTALAEWTAWGKRGPSGPPPPSAC